MRRVTVLLVIGLLLASAHAQAPVTAPPSGPDEQLQNSVVRIWWNRDLMGGGEYFHLAVDGTVIQNVMPRFHATYETDAWVYDDLGHVVAYLGPAAGWIVRGPIELVLRTVSGQSMLGKLVGIDEAQGLAVVETEAATLHPPSAPLKIEFKPYSGFYLVSLDTGFSFQTCTLLNAARQRGLDEHKLRFAKMPDGRMGNLLFARDGKFAGFLTGSPKSPASGQGGSVNLMPVEQIVPSVQKILQTRSSIQSGWLGLFLRDLPAARRPGLGGGGIVVSRLVPGGPGAKAGILEDDIILKVNEVPAENLSQVVRMIQKSPVGSSLRLDVLRGDKLLQIHPAVGTREEVETARAYLVDLHRKRSGQLHIQHADEIGLVRSRNAIFLGIYTSDSVEPSKSRGPVIAEVAENTPAAQAGLKKGDVILQVNDTIVQNMDQYVAALMKNLLA